MGAKVEVLVDGDRHRIDVPAEWSGALTITVNVHRGSPSKKIFVARAQAVMLEPDATDQREPDGGAVPPEAKYGR